MFLLWRTGQSKKDLSFHEIKDLLQACGGPEARGRITSRSSSLTRHPVEGAEEGTDSESWIPLEALVWGQVLQFSRKTGQSHHCAKMLNVAFLHIHLLFFGK